MSPVLSSPNDRNPPDDPKPDCLVSVIVPEEFTGTSMKQLHQRGGIIKQMNCRDRNVVIHALIPEGQYAELVSAIKEWTQGRGKVERQPDVDE